MGTLGMQKGEIHYIPHAKWDEHPKNIYFFYGELKSFAKYQRLKKIDILDNVNKVMVWICHHMNKQ